MQEFYIRNWQIGNFKEVGNGAVIGAGSVVMRGTPDNAIAVRVPAACSGNA
jgi:acetyltransferase-like isoleucine patch superfamily enzyme